MSKFISIVLYTALMFGANAAAAQNADLMALRLGDMKKLNLHSDAKETSEVAFETIDGSPIKLSDYHGKFVLLNFWATWCAPCRAEMPSLDQLHRELGGDHFEVVTIATGRNPVPSMKKFFADAGIQSLPLHRDPKQKLARDMAVLGLPVTVILNPEGQEFGRLIGDADWSGTEAKNIITALINSPLNKQ